ncbi:hypothetical protein SAMN02745225_02334 [Ferrithrix thermotolerans DSM 19514]|uniref:Uncharacterized protein n=1 Tax=Ferrithrix thermotolerans DSM 19514 TaxID=1121881 RepID=A0A1M4YGB9_9ACTN|nr:hypothetical protein SAMN02745225_02334 [Ferrithrix thermotolerans DSM 19514]
MARDVYGLKAVSINSFYHFGSTVDVRLKEHMKTVVVGKRL